MAILAAARGVHSAVSGLAQVSPSAHPSGPATGTQAPADDGTAAAIRGVLDAIGEPFHLNGLGVLCALGLIGWLISQMPKLPKRTAQQKATDEAIGKAGKAVGGALGRFLTGRPISAKTAAKKKAGGASFWNNALPEPEPLSAPPAAMGAIALPGPATGPDFREVLSDRLVAFTDWVGSLPVPRLLVQLSDVGAIVAYALAVAGRWLARGVRGVLMLPVALWRGVASYGRWAYVSVLMVRAAVPGVWALYEVAPSRTLTGALVAGGGALVAGFTGPDGLGKWHGPRPSDDQLYGPWLWSMLKAALHLPLEAEKEKWLTVPTRLEDEGAQVILRLPDDFRGSVRERADLDDIVNLRLPGDWVSEWRLMGGGHKAVWTARRAARELVGDEATYGPALWPILRDRLGLDEDADLMEDWLTIPADLADREAVVRLVLPLGFVGAELDRQDLTTLVNIKLPGDWVAKWSIKAGQQDGDHWVEWTHRPPAPPKPACPDFLDFFDPRIQEAIFSCKPGEVVVGMDAFGQIVKMRLEGDSAHWALSIGSGGGKSNLIQFIILQLVWQGWTVIATDPKRNSVACFDGLPGFYLYNDPLAVGDMRRAVSWFQEVAKARQFVSLRNPEIQFPGMVFIMEEANETADLSREWWRRNKAPKAPAADPFWANVASTLRTARNVNGHVIGVFQDLRDDKTGNQGMSVLFPEVIMGKIKEKQWDRIIGGRMPDIAGNDRAGRILVNRDGERIWVQVPSCDPPGQSPARYMDWATEARRRNPWSWETAGLYGTVPAPSEQEVPSLLKGTSHDPAVNPSPRVLLDKIPAQSHDTVKDDARPDSPRDTRPDAPRDALAGWDLGPELRDAVTRILDRQGVAAQAPADQPEPQDAPQAPAEPEEERLSIAEIARRFKALGIPVSEANIRQHKTRNKELFPKGEKDAKGKETFLASEIRTYFEGVEARKRARAGE